MKNIIIVYGSSTGNSESVADLIAENVNGDATVYSADVATDELFAGADLVVFGSSTWGAGELQDDFQEFYDVFVDEAFLSGKDVAVFGLGDSESFEDTFCEAANIIEAGLKEAKANITVPVLKVDGDPDDNKEAIIAFAKSL